MSLMSIDKILTGKYTGVPVFILTMTLVFYLTFNMPGRLLSDILSVIIDSSVNTLACCLQNAGTSPALQDLIIDGICAGVGSVLSFIPVIAVLFFFLSILEESGYLPKVAVLLDRPMKKIGLSGKCVVPLVMSFGCAVPAVLTAGSMLSGRERTTVISMLPFMSCSARLPVYAMFTSIFFHEHRAAVMSGIYITGIIIAVLYALSSKLAASAGNHPQHSCTIRASYRASYRKPDMHVVFTSVCTNVMSFVRKAFTVIFTASVVIWFLRSFDGNLHLVSDSADSLLAAMGKAAAPVFAPLGFGDWRAASAVIAGISAKEAIISTFAVLSGSPNGSALFSMLSVIFSPAGAFSFLIFCLLYMPCIATLTAIRHQTGSWLHSIRLAAVQLATAWFSSFIIYRAGLLLICLL